VACLQPGRAVGLTALQSAGVWDLAIVGAGPAGTAAALAALNENPRARVVLLDRATFPRDKSCGDGIASHALDVLADVGITGLLDDWTPVRRLVLQTSAATADRTMARPLFVVPRTVFDHRLVQAAVARGAVFRHQRVRTVRREASRVVIDDVLDARVVLGADGAGSVVRSALGLAGPRHQAVAIRGYAPTSGPNAGKQIIRFAEGCQPAYAWMFDRGDGLSNVGYGELLTSQRPRPTRQHLLGSLDRLLPGSVGAASDWLGHLLPLSSWRWRHPDGPVLLAGDAAGLINPVTGEGIYYAVATGVAAGRAAAAALARGTPAATGRTYRRAVHTLLASHRLSSAAGSRLMSVPHIASAVVRAAAADEGVFDDLLEVGLGNGRVTAKVVASAGSSLIHR
jgi:menaquinone-9 beta-reductase